jgi:uncharacterized protein
MMTRQIPVKPTYANTFFKRLKGLLGTHILPRERGLLLEPCSSIHTWGMNYPIDAVFLSETNEVVHIESELAPNRWGKQIREARKVLEIKAGLVKTLEIQIGDRIEFMEEMGGSC